MTTFLYSSRTGVRGAYPGSNYIAQQGNEYHKCHDSGSQLGKKGCVWKKALGGRLGCE